MEVKSRRSPCKTEGCKGKTFHYRDYCFSCRPKKAPGRKGLGNRKLFGARLGEKQQLMLKDYYGGSLQLLVDTVLNKDNFGKKIP